MAPPIDPALAARRITEQALRDAGWTLGPEFEHRYLTDPWVFNLVNLVGRYAQRVAELETKVAPKVASR